MMLFLLLLNAGPCVPEADRAPHCLRTLFEVEVDGEPATP
jgi:hypothetical protein